ncbi:transmembrane protein 256 homolog [Argonauta hians]
MEWIKSIGDSIYSRLPLGQLPPQIKETVFNLPGKNFVRIAGICGALAVGMAALGEHYVRRKVTDPKLIHMYGVANNIHLLHSAALLAVPLTRRPLLVGSLLATGVLLFSGSCYYETLTTDKRLQSVTPIGGSLLILGWICIAI